MAKSWGIASGFAKRATNKISRQQIVTG